MKYLQSTSVGGKHYKVHKSQCNNGFLTVGGSKNITIFFYYFLGTKIVLIRINHDYIT